MKVTKRTAQAFASMVVLSLLMTGSVFAYSTQISHLSSIASPLANDNQSTTTNSTTTSHEGGHDNNQTTTATSTTASKSEVEQTLVFKLVPVSGATGSGNATVQIRGNEVRVELRIDLGPNSTGYSVVLVTTTATSPSCTGSLGTLMTSDKGEAEAELRTTLPTGTFPLGLVLCADGKPSLMSDPANKTTTISSATTTESETEETHEVNTKQEDQKDQDDIKSAKDSKQIPVEVEVSGSDAKITQIDSKFSVSVSRPSDNSLSVSIAGTNVTGPRVLLISIAKDAGALSSLGSLKVSYDGIKISEASSLSQVLSGTSTSPASFIVLLTSTGAQLLVFIPHFSSHLIELLASPAPLGTFIAQAPLLLAGFAAVAAVAAALFMRRKRFAAPAAL